ncbi:MAG: ABC transporter permease [Clostridiales bacterium]|nr:ABC transporter permease [Clostridiales bacterium]
MTGAAMNDTRWSPAALLLIALGLALIVAGTVPLATTGERLQYAVALTDQETQAAKVMRLSDKVGDVREQVGTAAAAVAAAGCAESVSVNAGGDSCTARLVCADEGWFDVEPVQLVSGRGFMRTELVTGANCALLDERLAFSLFGADIPEDAKVEIGTRTCSVIGTVRAKTCFGVKTQYCAWMPLRALLGEDDSGSAAAGLALDTLTIEARPAGGAGTRELFENTARSAWQAGGTSISLAKEAMRGTVILRIVALALGFAVWGRLLGRANAFAAGQIDRYRRLLRERYFPRTIPRLLAMGLTWALAYGALLAAAYGLLSLAFHPLLTFTEWVPDDFTSWSSLTKVFWNLIAEHATLVRTGTWALREVQFYAGLARWGVISLLSGIAMTAIGRR